MNRSIALTDRRTAPRVVVIAAVLATAAVAAGLAVGDGAQGAAASPAAKPKWLTISGLWDGVTAPNFVGSAAGRGWLSFYKSPTSSSFASIRLGGGKLSYSKATLAAQNPMFLDGSQLVFHLPDPSGKPGALRVAPLLANGAIGSPKAISDDPEGLPPEVLEPVAIAVARNGDRRVWVMRGAKLGEGGGLLRSYVWACCSTTGELKDLTRFIKQGRLSLFTQIGIDSQKRLWLAWLESSRAAVVGSVKLLEIDPDTLAPQTPSAITAAGGSTATSFALACAATCRVVLTDLFSGDALSSSATDRSATKMVSGTREQPANVLAVSFRSGRLAAATVAVRTPNPAKATVDAIEVVAGNARGARPHPVSSIDLPSVLGRLEFRAAYATFVPGGLAFFALYYPYGGGSRVFAGVLTTR
jgi:hypothetical protein